tara:strand:+ start:5356 stop:6066 length:711 start_codon:yes stop_codon:yes gene_type:complete
LFLKLKSFIRCLNFLKAILNIMNVKYFIGGYDKNICYLVWCNESKYAAIIDPSVEINPILEFIESKNLVLDKILITHSHHDHIKFLSDILSQFSLIKVYISHCSSKRFGYLPLNDNQIINIGTEIITVLETPGHYYDSICFWNSKDKFVFTGDTMFIGRTGRVLSEKSSIEKLYHSIYKVLLKLPHDTMIYPGHDYGYKINDTIKNNIQSSKFFTCQNLSDFKLVMKNFERNRKKS